MHTNNKNTQLAGARADTFLTAVKSLPVPSKIIASKDAYSFLELATKDITNNQVDVMERLLDGWLLEYAKIDSPDEQFPMAFEVLDYISQVQQSDGVSAEYKNAMKKHHVVEAASKTIITTVGKRHDYHDKEMEFDALIAVLFLVPQETNIYSSALKELELHAENVSFEAGEETSLYQDPESLSNMSSGRVATAKAQNALGFLQKGSQAYEYLKDWVGKMQSPPQEMRKERQEYYKQKLEPNAC